MPTWVCSAILNTPTSCSRYSVLLPVAVCAVRYFFLGCFVLYVSNRWVTPWMFIGARWNLWIIFWITPSSFRSFLVVAGRCSTVGTIPQIISTHIRPKKCLVVACFWFALGLFKSYNLQLHQSKFCWSDFDAPTLYTGLENLFGVYGYALQIYCDFSGYSDMAIGIALLLLGFHFNLNFDSPYQSKITGVLEAFTCRHQLATRLFIYILAETGKGFAPTSIFAHHVIRRFCARGIIPFTFFGAHCTGERSLCISAYTDITGKAQAQKL